jgi:hypothetical protein
VEEVIRTLDANYLSTSHLPRPASGPAPFHLVRPLGPVLRVLLGIGGGLYALDFLLFLITPGFFGLI